MHALTTAQLCALPAAHWPLVKSLFEAVLEEAPPERAARLAGAEPAVAAEVGALLAQHEAEEAGGAGFLARPAWEALPVVPARDPRAAAWVDGVGASAEAGVRAQLGPWRLVAPLGAGGMGEVWEARRADGAYEARAAVKVLRRDFASPELLAHFEREARLLARLNHPHIARLLDAGRTPDGHPYLVMEVVSGRPIDEACRDRPLPARIELLRQLAEALEHAHRQGLVHRDIKPGNVLVTGEGQVKLLDFGIATALDPGLDGPSAPGAAGLPAPALSGLTPAYASPEQVRGEPAGAASDLYSFGVLAYRLLTGQRPYVQPPNDLEGAFRAVLEVVPPPASRTPLPTQGDSGVPRRQLRGDLDALLARALAKAPQQRYPSMEALSADLQAWAARRPLAVRLAGLSTPAAALYRAHRFARRHAAVVAAGGLAAGALLTALGLSAWRARDALALLALLSLGAGLAAALWQARRAAAARDEARARLAGLQGLVRDIVMRHADTVTYLPGGLRMKGELLAGTLQHLEQWLAWAPADAALAGEAAKAHARLADLQTEGADATLNDPEAAARHAARALELFPAGEPAHREDVNFYLWWARALATSSLALRKAGDAAGALRHRERQRDLLRGALLRFAGRSDETFTLRHEYGSALLGCGQAYDTWLDKSLKQPEAALQAFAQAESVYLELHAERPEDPETVYQLGTVAGARMIVLHGLRRLDEATARGLEAVRWREQAMAQAPDQTVFSAGLAGECSNATMVLLDAGDVVQALAVSERGEQVMRALEASDPQEPLWAERRRFFSLHRGRALLAAGDATAALPRLADAMAGMAEAATPAQRRRRGRCGLALAQALQALGRAGEADAAATQARSDLEALLSIEADDDEARRWLRDLDAIAPGLVAARHD